jgi:hypothetical protein
VTTEFDQAYQQFLASRQGQQAESQLSTSPPQPAGPALEQNPGYQSDAVPGADLSGWSPMGSPKALSALGPNDLVMWQGMRTPAKVAEQIGLVERVPGGGYRPTASAQAEAGGRAKELAAGQARERAEAAERAAALALPPEAQQSLDVLTSAVPSHVQDAALAELAGGEGMSGRTIATAASHLGVSPEEAVAAIGRVAEALSDQVGRVMAAEGVDDADGFDAWIKQTGREGQYRSAQRLHLYSGQFEGYRAMAREYLRATAGQRQDRYATAEADRGIEVRKVGRVTLVKVPGYPEMQADVARSMGLVSLGRD